MPLLKRRITMVVFSIDQGGSIMLADRYGLPLSRASAVARDAYVQGWDHLLTLYPATAEAFNRAIAAAPGVALPPTAKAQGVMRDENEPTTAASFEAPTSHDA